MPAATSLDLGASSAPAGGPASAAPPAPTSPPVTRRELGWAILGCALLATLFLAPALFTGRFLSPADMLYDYYPWYVVRPDSYTRPGNNGLSDSVLQFEPFLRYSAQRLHEGALPLWNPYNMLGAPFIANMQSAVFYPGNWPYFLWPDGSMLVVRVWLKLVIAALGMYLLAREAARAGPLGAAVAAITFAFGAFMMVWLLYPLTAAAAWLPWLWWATARLVARPGPRPLAALAAIVGISLLAGQPELAYYQALTTGLFAVFLLWQHRAGGWRRLGGALGLWVAAYCLGALLAAIQLLPFVEYLGESAALRHRADPEVTNFWLPFHYAWTVFSPDLYGNTAHRNWWDPGTNYNESNNYSGILPLLLAPFALVVPDRAQRRLALFLAGAVLLAVGIIYHWAVIYDLAVALPLMQVGANQRLTVAIQMALGLLAALGVEAIRQHAARYRGRLLGGLALIALGLLLGGIGVPWIFTHGYFEVPVGNEAAQQVWRAALLRGAVVIGLSGAVLAGVLVLWTARPRWWRAGAVLLPLVLLADVWQARWDYNPTVARAHYYPDTPVTRFLQQQPGPFRTVATGWLFMPNINLYYGIGDLRGYDAIEPQLYKEVAVRIDRTFAAGGGGGFYPFNNVQSRFINPLNVRYLLTAPGEDPNYIIAAEQPNRYGHTVGEIRGAQRPGQSFVAHQDNLARIQVLGTNYGQQAQGRVIFHLKTDPAAPEDLVRIELDAAELPNNDFWTISFPPISPARDRPFYFYFESPDAPENQATSLWYGPGDPYGEGTRTNNGRPAEGDLVFRALALLDPDDPWFRRVYDGGLEDAGIYENRQALPRAWLTHRVEVEPDPAARLLRLRNPDFDEAGTALLAAPLPPELVLPAAPPAPGADQVTITRYAPEQVDITATSPAPGLLILADQVFPGWTATVDGQPAPILTADHALRAVYLPAGTHTVRFVYQPLSFSLGAAGTGAGLLALIVLVAWPRRRGAPRSV